MLNPEYYLNQLNLENLIKKSAYLYQMRCPICGDSKTIKQKKRGFLIYKNQDWFYFCHNCSYASSFKYFIHSLNSNLYKKYIKDSFLNKNKEIQKEIGIKSGELIEPENYNFFKLSSKYLKNNDKWKFILEKADQFLFDRKLEFLRDKIFLSLHQKWYFRIILPIFNETGMYGFQARTLTKSHNKYLTFFCDESQPKIYNYFNIDKENPILVTEGIIDSLFLNNSIAMLGSNLYVKNTKLDKFKDKLIFIFDNDVTGKEKQEKYLNKGFSIATWPNQFSQYKDINEIIQHNNINKDDLSQIFIEKRLTGFKGKILYKLNKDK